MTTAIAPEKPAKAAPRKSDFNTVLAQLSQLCAGLQPGDTVPSHVTLAQNLAVSEFSVLRALDHLRRDGTIIRRQGASTVIAERQPAGPSRARESEALRPAPARTPGLVGVLGRFAPEISELLVPYIIGQSLEHAIGADKKLSLSYFDCFRDEKYSVSFADGAAALLAQDIEALCVISPEVSQVDAILTHARAARTPVLFITETQIPQAAPQVYIDHRYDGYQAANYLLDAGYKDVTFVMLGRHGWALDRLAGVRDAFRQAGLPESAVRVFPAETREKVAWRRSEFKSELQEWVITELRAQRFYGAFIGANDHVALDILEAAETELGSRARDFVILGFDDKPEAIRRGLTTFRPPLLDMGQEGARLLGQLLAHGEIRRTSHHARLASQIVVRASTKFAANSHKALNGSSGSENRPRGTVNADEGSHVMEIVNGEGALA